MLMGSSERDSESRWVDGPSTVLFEINVHQRQRGIRERSERWMISSDLAARQFPFASWSIGND